MPEVVAESQKVPETPPVTQSGKSPVLTGWEPNFFFFLTRYHFFFWNTNFRGCFHSGPLLSDVYPNPSFMFTVFCLFIYLFFCRCVTVVVLRLILRGYIWYARLKCVIIVMLTVNAKNSHMRLTFPVLLKSPHIASC